MKSDPFTPGTQRAAEVAPTAAAPQAGLLDGVVARSGQPPPVRAEGIAIGTLDAWDGEAGARVSVPGLPLQGVAARALVPLDASRVGQPVALGFEAGDPRRPLVLGFVWSAAGTVATAGVPHEVVLDGERVVLQAEREIELRCGEAAIVLSADGRIQLRGSYITSQASATQRILGGCVHVN